MKFIFWRWEIWDKGGGSGVEWKFLNKVIFPKRHSPLWLIFNLQRRKKWK